MRQTKNTRSVALLALVMCAGLAGGVRGEDAADGSKTIAEFGTRSLVEETRDDAGAAPSDNPRVLPGRVKWHADQAAAERAAVLSGKPVLVFQLLGRLDEEFC